MHVLKRYMSAQYSFKSMTCKSKYNTCFSDLMWLIYPFKKHWISMYLSTSSVPELLDHLHVSICSVQPEATHQLTSTPLWLMASPSSVLGLPGQSTHWSTGWALSQVNDCVDKIFVVSRHLLKVIPINVFFPRHDSGPFPVYGPYSKDIFQESAIFSKNPFQSTKRR